MYYRDGYIGGVRASAIYVDVSTPRAQVQSHTYTHAMPRCACRAILLDIGDSAYVARCIRDPMTRCKVIARQFRLAEREGERERDARIFAKYAKRERGK